MTCVVTFGEIMLRLSLPGNLRFSQVRNFDVIYGGGKSNMAVSLAQYGINTEYVTRLPAKDIGDACLNFVRRFGVGTKRIVRGGERRGIYFPEQGALHRGSNVIYGACLRGCGVGAQTYDLRRLQPCFRIGS
jgi:2-dehydro-3-deoxygluconokinase